MQLKSILAAIPLALVAACATMAGSGDRGSAGAVLAAIDGSAVGTATISQARGGLLLHVSARGLSPGQHGVHVHAVGSCAAPKFASAGGHWNPAVKKHGLASAEGHHAGDMPNLIVGNDGRGTLKTLLAGATLAGLLDADGAALVIHAATDDQLTDPSGNSGDRIACGVFAPG